MQHLRTLAFIGIVAGAAARRPAPPRAAVMRLRGGLSVGSLAASYGAALSTSPILTKSVTAGAIFGLSDATAQSLDTPDGGRDWARTAVSCLVGLCYFGPAAHAWYDTVFRLFPEGGVKSTLIKSALGQMFFGPTAPASSSSPRSSPSSASARASRAGRGRSARTWWRRGRPASASGPSSTW